VRWRAGAAAALLRRCFFPSSKAADFLGRVLLVVTSAVATPVAGPAWAFCSAIKEFLCCLGRAGLLSFPGGLGWFEVKFKV